MENLNNEAVKPKDELFNFLSYEWNVTKLKEYIETNENIEVQTVPLEEMNTYYKAIKSVMKFSEKEVDDADINIPSIIVEMKPAPSQEVLIVEGSNRLEKSMRSKAEHFMFIFIPFNEQIKFLTEPHMIVAMNTFKERMDYINGGE